MEHQGKKKNPYSGCLITMLFLTIVPVLSYWLCSAIVFKYQIMVSHEKNIQVALFFGCGIGLLFHLSCFLVGVFKDSLSIVKERMVEFKDNVCLSFWFAVKTYLLDMKSGGFAFLIYSIPMIINALLFVNALRLCVEYFL